MDFDLALREKEPTKYADDAHADKKNEYERWVKANIMVLLVIKRLMFDLVQRAIIELDNAKTYLDSIKVKFKEPEKAESSTLMNTVITIKYVGGDVREHILSMVDTSAKLNSLNIKIDDLFLVHLALNSLPPKYSQLKRTYITLQEKWDLNELIAIYVHEEQNIRQDKNKKLVNVVQRVNPASSLNDRDNPPQRNNNRGARRVNRAIGKKCFICKKVGHQKTECTRYKRWKENKECKKNKGTLHRISVCFQSNLVKISYDTWWLETGATIHVTNSLQRQINNRYWQGESEKDDGNSIECSELIGDRRLNGDKFELNCKIPMNVVNTVRHKRTLTNDTSSKFGYVYLLGEKSSAFAAFKIYKSEVENQLNYKIKIVRSDRGRECYGKFSTSGRQPGPFALFV
ncbi:uncharacterized protein [Pyrus communis]|uniref:uncharacterized protein n=1 Tax=Pyrus communis TaxID=23211 RepID=UPI0035C2228C